MTNKVHASAQEIAAAEAAGLSLRNYQTLRRVNKVAANPNHPAHEYAIGALVELEQGAVSHNAVELEIRRLNLGRPPKQQHKKGPGNGKKQLRVLTNCEINLQGISDALETVFVGGFERTCTPDIAKQYAKTFNVEIGRIRNIVNLLNAHGTDQDK